MKILLMLLVINTSFAGGKRTCEESLRICDDITDHQQVRMSDLKIDLKAEKMRNESKNQNDTPTIVWITASFIGGIILGMALKGNK